MIDADDIEKQAVDMMLAGKSPKKIFINSKNLEALTKSFYPKERKTEEVEPPKQYDIEKITTTAGSLDFVIDENEPNFRIE